MSNGEHPPSPEVLGRERNVEVGESVSEELEHDDSYDNLTVTLDSGRTIFVRGLRNDGGYEGNEEEVEIYGLWEDEDENKFGKGFVENPNYLNWFESEDEQEQKAQELLEYIHFLANKEGAGGSLGELSNISDLCRDADEDEIEALLDDLVDDGVLELDGDEYKVTEKAKLSAEKERRDEIENAPIDPDTSQIDNLEFSGRDGDFLIYDLDGEDYQIRVDINSLEGDIFPPALKNIEVDVLSHGYEPRIYEEEADVSFEGELDVDPDAPHIGNTYDAGDVDLLGFSDGDPKIEINGYEGYIKNLDEDIDESEIEEDTLLENVEPTVLKLTVFEAEIPEDHEYAEGESSESDTEDGDEDDSEDESDRSRAEVGAAQNATNVDILEDLQDLAKDRHWKLVNDEYDNPQRRENAKEFIEDIIGQEWSEELNLDEFFREQRRRIEEEQLEGEGEVVEYRRREMENNINSLKNQAEEISNLSDEVIDTAADHEVVIFVNRVQSAADSQQGVEDAMEDLVENILNREEYQGDWMTSTQAALNLSDKIVDRVNALIDKNDVENYDQAYQEHIDNLTEEIAELKAEYEENYKFMSGGQFNITSGFRGLFSSRPDEIQEQIQAKREEIEQKQQRLKEIKEERDSGFLALQELDRMEDEVNKEIDERSDQIEGTMYGTAKKIKDWFYGVWSAMGQVNLYNIGMAAEKGVTGESERERTRRYQQEVREEETAAGTAAGGIAKVGGRMVNLRSVGAATLLGGAGLTGYRTAVGVGAGIGFYESFKGANLDRLKSQVHSTIDKAGEDLDEVSVEEVKQTISTVMAKARFDGERLDSEDFVFNREYEVLKAIQEQKIEAEREAAAAVDETLDDLEHELYEDVAKESFELKKDKVKNVGKGVGAGTATAVAGYAIGEWMAGEGAEEAAKEGAGAGDVEGTAQEPQPSEPGGAGAEEGAVGETTEDAQPETTAGPEADPSYVDQEGNQLIEGGEHSAGAGDFYTIEQGEGPLHMLDDMWADHQDTIIENSDQLDPDTMSSTEMEHQWKVNTLEKAGFEHENGAWQWPIMVHEGAKGELFMPEGGGTPEVRFTGENVDTLDTYWQRTAEQTAEATEETTEAGEGSEDVIKRFDEGESATMPGDNEIDLFEQDQDLITEETAESIAENTSDTAETTAQEASEAAEGGEATYTFENTGDEVNPADIAYSEESTFHANNPDAPQGDVGGAEGSAGEAG
ncbi:MAG: hypothetical protein ABEJ24_02135, partial [Candidatus Magasanikbacteria bacterium]